MVREKKSVFDKLKNYIKSFNVNLDKEDYSLLFGQIIAFIFFVKEIVLFFVEDESNVKSSLFFLISAVFMFAFFVYFTVIGKRSIKISKGMRYIIWLFPFVVATSGNMLLYIYVDFDSQIYSFLFVIVILSFIQIYPKIRRLALYGYTFLLFLVINYSFNTFSNAFFKYSAMSLLMTIVSYTIALIHQQNYFAREEALNILDQKNEEKERTYKELENIYKDLLISHNITEKMLSITQDILTNDRLEDVLQRVIDEAIKIIPQAHAGSILLFNEGRMDFVACTGYNLERLQKINLSYEDSFQATLDEKYEPTIIKDLEVFDSINLDSEKFQSFKDNDVRFAKSCLTCSFKYQGEFFGSINLDNFDSKDSYKEADKYLIKQLANEIEIIISIHKLYEQAIKPTKIDELTKAYTRKYGMHLMEKTIKNKGNIVYSICFIDINELKKVNDDYGHDVGDKYLEYFAESVRNSKIRENIFSRIGGDEFLLVFKGLDSESAFKEIIKIKKQLELYPFKHNKITRVIDFAVGVASYPKDGKDILQLIKLADGRMYIDKKNIQEQ